MAKGFCRSRWAPCPLVQPPRVLLSACPVLLLSWHWLFLPSSFPRCPGSPGGPWGPPYGASGAQAQVLLSSSAPPLYESVDLKIRLSGRPNLIVALVQLLSHVQLFATLWTAVHQASLSFTTSWSLLKSCPLGQWCHLTILFSVITFSFCLQSSKASGSFLMTQLFASGGQSIGASALASVLPIYPGLISFRIDWFDPLNYMNPLKAECFLVRNLPGCRFNVPLLAQGWKMPYQKGLRRSLRNWSQALAHSQ